MRSLGRCFRLLVSTKHNSWVCVLPKVNDWINNIPHSSTGYSPKELYFNIKPNRPCANKITFPNNNSNIDTYQILLENVVINLKIEAEKRKRKHAVKNPASFNVNDYVLVKTSHLSSALKKERHKFFEIYEGPFIISKIVGPNAYLLVNPQNGEECEKFNSYRLRPYNEPLM